MSINAGDHSLEDGADYGRLAFDRFVLEKWDDTSHAADEQQWSALVHEYLAMTPLQRFPYVQACCCQHPPLPSPSSNEVNRKLAPFQTVSERNLLALRASHPSSVSPIWLRTSYDPDLEDAYATLVSPLLEVSDFALEGGGILDDAALYDFDPANHGGSRGMDSWRDVLLRLPELTDTIRHAKRELYEPAEGNRKRAAEEYRGGLDLLDRRMAAWIYLVDKDAVEEGLVKVVWLDTHGECLWWNRVNAEDIGEFTGAWGDCASMEEIVTGWAGPEKGDILSF